MKNLTTIGIDLAKNSFQLHGVDANGKVVLKKKVSRCNLAKFFANHDKCLVGMESCAGSAYWARIIESCGHEVRRMHPIYVKPYLIGDKTDANDAAAICEAVTRPHMRFAPHKTQEQSDIQALHRVRNGFVQDRTAKINESRGLLAENGIVIRQGAANLKKMLPEIIGDLENDLSGMMREILQDLNDTIRYLDEKIEKIDLQLKNIVEQREECRRLMQIPGIGSVAASILITVAGRPVDFKNGRNFSAYLGLVPKQHSTGGKTKMLGISKKGDSYIRTILINGARSVLGAVIKYKSDKIRNREWLESIHERRGHNKACVALANKMARTAWSLLANGTEYTKA